MTKTAWTILAIVVLVGIAQVSLLAVPQQAIDTQRSPLTTTPADVNLAYENFSISPADTHMLTLHGWWIPAPGAEAVLVFIHGGGSNRHSRYFGSLKFYRAMVDNKVSVAAIDLRNHGESGSDGRGLQFGRTEQHDALAAIDWTRNKVPDLPLYAMGISMGGATVIQAAHAGAPLDGLILMDSVLDTRDAFSQGGWVETGLPAALFKPSAWSATQFFGLPDGDTQPLELAAGLRLPILVLQDPDDPVTRVQFSRELARRNPNVSLWIAPPIDPEHPELAWKGRWGSHVSAFLFYPQETVDQIMQFIDSI